MLVGLGDLQAITIVALLVDVDHWQSADFGFGVKVRRIAFLDEFLDLGVGMGLGHLADPVVVAGKVFEVTIVSYPKTVFNFILLF